MQTGLDRLPHLPKVLARLAGSRVGLLTHPAAVDRKLVHSSDVLLRAGIVPRVLFGPEHGYGGEAQDMASVRSDEDGTTGTPIVSLYGESFEDLTPKPEHLERISVLLIDLADIGTRFYTFVWTALMAMRAAHRAGVEVIVLDRPNPISGRVDKVEGRTQAPGYLSFVGLEAIPIRHSLTIGEILSLFAVGDGIPLGKEGGLSVVQVTDWDASRTAAAWDRPFVMPSPNMPTLDTALVYPGGCLLEGTNLSEGRGTTRPFEIVGAPFLDGRALARELMKLELPGFVARPISFQPTFHKFAGESCGGVQIHVLDAEKFRPVATYTALVALAQAQARDRFRFRTERYEYVDDIPAFDLLTGSSEVRRQIESGEDPAAIASYAAESDVRFSETMAAAKARAAQAAVC